MNHRTTKNALQFAAAMKLQAMIQAQDVKVSGQPNLSEISPTTESKGGSEAEGPNETEGNTEPKVKISPTPKEKGGSEAEGTNKKKESRRKH